MTKPTPWSSRAQLINLWTKRGLEDGEINMKWEQRYESNGLKEITDKGYKYSRKWLSVNQIRWFASARKIRWEGKLGKYVSSYETREGGRQK